MASASPEVVRTTTDQQVLQLLYDGPRSRAELAAVGGFSKPTASESVRRLEALGLVAETGERRHGVGRTATLVGVPPGAGVGLAVCIDPSGVRATTHSVSGQVVEEITAQLSRTHGSRAVTSALRKAVRSVAERSDRSGRPIRTAAVSAADPVRRSDGRLAELPDAPFLVGSLDARKVLSSYVDGDVLVDNDVNWAAAAELAAREDRADFGYLHLGAGLGGAVVNDGVVRRGHHGFVGEIAHVIVSGPGGLAMPITQVFAELELRQSNSTAIDLNRVCRALDDSHSASVIGRALAGVISAFVAVADPSVMVLGGPWGEAAIPSVEAALADAPRRVPVCPAVVDDPATKGVGDGAVDGIRRWVSEAALSRA